MRASTLFAFALSIIALASVADATFFGMHINSVTVTPSEPTVGDTLSIKTSFTLSGPADPKVKLRLYVDGDLTDTHTDFYGIGVQSYTFSFDTSGMSSGTHDIVVVAEVYDGDIMTSSDTGGVAIYLKDKFVASGSVHDITITQISYPNPALSGAKIPVTVFVKNTGSLFETGVKIVVRLGGDVWRSDFFDIKRGETTARTIYVTVPNTAGTYDIAIEAENNAFHKVVNRIDVVQASLTLGLNPSTANVGDYITVAGYALSGTGFPATSVSVYTDGSFAATAMPDRSGYYSTSVRFFTTGLHTVAVRLGSIEKYVTIRINPAPVPPLSPPPVQPGQNYTTVCFNITAPGACQANVTNATIVPPAAPYASVETSAKELYADQYKANVLYLFIRNHLGRAGLFTVKSDFDPKMVFLPAPQVLDDGEEKPVGVIFNPQANHVGFISGNVQVLEGNRSIYSSPLSVFVVQKRAAIVSGAAVPSFALLDYVLAAIIFALALGIAFMLLRRPKPLEPKIIPSAGILMKKAVTTAPMQRKLSKYDIFRVPWRNVIC